MLALHALIGEKLSNVNYSLWVKSSNVRDFLLLIGTVQLAGFFKKIADRLLQ